MTEPTKDQKFQFLLAEYNSLRKEIENTTSKMRNLVTYVLLASGGFWTWYTSLTVKKHFFIKCVPFSLSLIFALYNFALSKDMKRTGDYLAKLEKSIVLPDDLGWENHIRKVGWAGLADYWEYLFWTTLLVGNLLGAKFF